MVWAHPELSDREVVRRPDLRPVYTSNERYRDELHPGERTPGGQEPRLVAKVEWHPGELYPRVGFIVTNRG